MPLANGQITIVDLNDAILSGTAPANPVEGTLWIDTSVDPNKLYSWNGSNWIEQTLSVSALDPDFDQQVQDLKDFAKNAADDGMLSSGEKLNIKLLLVEITGETIFDSTLPTLTEIDASKAGQVYMIRAEAKAAGIPTDQSDYTAFETAYADLKVYLESLTPRPWDKGNTVIDPVDWANAWDSYYDKLTKLQVTTSTYLANSVKPGEDYNGVKMTKEQGVVVLRGDNLFRTTLNATQGLAIEKNNSGTWVKVFYTNTDGKMYATSLVIDSSSTIAGTAASTVRDNAANGLANANTANDKISLNTDTNNYNPNPSFEGKKNTYYTACTAFAATDSGVPTGAPKPYVGRQTGRDNYISDFFSVKAGEKFIVEGWIASTDSAYNFGLGLNAQDNIGTNTWLVSNHKPKGDGTWQYFSNTYTIPSTATKARFFSQINATSSFGNWFFTDVRITKVIVDDVIASASTWNTAKDNVNDMLSDLKVTPLEKSQLSRDWEAIKAEYTSLIQLANSVSSTLSSAISTTAYTTAYNNLDGTSPKIQTDILANMNTTYTFTSTSARDSFKTKMNTYFSESEKLKTTINDKINGTAKGASDKIDNLKVGGSNIMPNSSGEIDSDGDGIPDNWSIFQQANNLTRDTGRLSGYSIKATANANPGSAFRSPSTSIKGGETYTVSLWMKRSNDGDLANLIKFRNASGTESNPFPAVTVQATAGTWTFISQTITAPSDAIIMYQTPRMNTSPDGTNFWVDDVQVEVGNVATDWSASQADIDYFISKVQSAADSAQNTANTAIKQGYVVTNPIFSDWTGTFPNYFSAWSSSTVAKETNLTRTGSAMRFNVAADTTQVGATITSGFFIPKLPNNKYYAMELDFMLVSGSITGAAVLLDWNGMNPYRATVNLSEYVSNPSLNTWYTVRAIVKRPTDTLTGYTGMMGYLMANYSGSTTNKAKNIIYDRLVFREPTSEEIAAYEVTQIVNGRVEVDGGRLTANSVKAESIDAKRLSVKDNNGTQTFLIDNNGQVTVNGKVYINSNSIFAEGYDPSITPGGRNVLLNSRFSTADFTGWTPWNSPATKEVIDITDLPGFDKAVKFVLTDKNQGLLQNVSVIKGNKYTISAYVKADSGQPVLQVFDGSAWPNVSMALSDVGTGNWVRLSKVFVANATTVQAQIGRGGGGANGTCYFTGVKIEEGDKTTGWSASPEDIDKLFDAVVSPDGTIKARDIASSLAVTPEAIQFISQAIDLKGKVTFSDLAQGWAYDENGNKINNSDQPDYDPANPLYLTTDGYYRPLSDENLFLSSLFTTDDAGRTVIDGNFIKTGTIQAKYADFMDLQVFNADGELSLWIDTDGNLSTVGTSKSAGYEAGKKGWKIDANGEAEFNSALFRGDIELGYYDVATDTFKVSGGVQSGQDASGRALRFWAGDSIDNAPFKVFSDGSLYATQGTFTGTFSGIVQVGNVTIQDNPDIAGDASITITDNALIEKVVLSESKVSINTNTTFGNFMNVDINNKKLLFGDSSFQLDYQNNLIQMNQYTIQGTSSLNFISDGSTGNDFVFKSTQGDTTVYAEGSFSVRDDISFLNTLVMRKASDSGNKGIDFVLI